MPPVPQRARNRPQPHGPNGQFLPGALPHIARAPQPPRAYRSRLNLNDRSQVQRRKILVDIVAKRPRINGHFLPGSITSTRIPGRPQTRRHPAQLKQVEDAIITAKRHHYQNRPQVYRTNFLNQLHGINKEYNTYLVNHKL